MNYQLGDFPISEDISARILSLPMHPYLEEDDIEIDLSVSDDEEEISEGLLNDLKKNSLVLNDRKKTKVKLSPADSKALTNAYGKLNSANKKKFEAELMKDKMSFETMLDFAKQT